MKKKILNAVSIILLVLYIALQGKAQSSLHVSVTGSGKQQAILIPGFTCSGDVWKTTVAELSKTYTCHVITFAGFAGEPAQNDPQLKNWVSDIAAYIKEKKLDKPVIVGHSIGGGLAMWLAADYPQLVSKIVVVDALPCLAAAQNPAFIAKQNPDCSLFVSRYVSMNDSTLYQMQKMTMPMLCADTAMQPTLINWSMQSDRKTMGQIYCEFLNTDLRDTVSRIECPALVLLESSFKMNDVMMQQQFSKLKNKQIVYATKGLHFIMYDDKDWYLGQIKGYLL